MVYITEMEIKALNKAGDWQGKLLSRGKSNHHSAYFTLRDTLLASCHHPFNYRAH